MALPFDATVAPARRRKRGHVRETSVLAKQAESARLEGRAAETLHHLQLWWLAEDDAPTSAELARWYHRHHHAAGVLPEWTADLLFIRRGISDLQTRGVVEAVPHGKRTCAVTGRTCTTWRIRQR